MISARTFPRTYRLLVMLCYASTPGDRRPRRWLGCATILFGRLVLGLVAALVVFGWPESLDPAHPVRAVFYRLSYAAAVLTFALFFGSLWRNLARWALTMLLHGSISLQVLKVMRHARLHRAYTTESSPLTGLVVACPLFALYWWTGTPFALAFAVFVLHNCILARALRMYLPPSALFLTTSMVQTLELHARIAVHLHTFRVAQLLKADYSSQMFRVFIRRDCFRTRSDDEWEGLVSAFIQICPVVILDARQVTPATRVEADRIAKANISHKLVILAGQVGERPLLEVLGMSSQGVFRHDVPVVREAGLLTLLQHLFIKRPELPTDRRPLADIIRSIPTWETIDRSEWPSR